MLPSKELLSAVIGIKVYDCGLLGSNLLEYSTYKSVELSRYKSINIYELMHMMKEWSWDNGYQITSSYKSVVMDSKAYCEVIDTESKAKNDDGENMYMCVMTHGADTEFKAVTKACEWIFNEK